MRASQYRGKTMSGKWLYGSLVNTTMGNTKTWIVVSARGNGGWFNVIQRNYVKPETVGQFTGLYDKNGKKIYEGDICIVSLSYFKIKDEKATVIFRNGSFQFQYGYDQFFSKPHDAWDEVVVIGNIYDNEYLLKTEVTNNVK